MKNLYKYIFWDFGDTLVGLNTQIKNQIANRIFKQCSQEVDLSILDKIMQKEWELRGQPEAWEKIKDVHTQDQERAYYADFFESVLKRLGIEDCIQSELLLQLSMLKVSPSSYHVFQDAISAIDEFSNLGLRQAIISNGFQTAPIILESSVLRGKFDFEVWSYQHNTIKPELEIYHIALGKADCRAEETIFVDDRKSFVKAANALKMFAIQIDRSQLIPIRYIDDGSIPVVNSLTEITKLIDSRNRANQKPGLFRASKNNKNLSKIATK